MAENSTASATGPKVEGSKVVVPHADAPEVEKKNGANAAHTVGGDGSYPSAAQQITEPNAMRKQLEDLTKAVADLTKFVTANAQAAPAEPELTKEEQELVKVLEDYFEDLEKRFEAKMESRLAKHEESLKKMALVPVGTTPAAPVPTSERTVAIDPAMRKEEAALTKSDGARVKTFDEMAKEIAAGQGLKGRFS